MPGSMQPLVPSCYPQVPLRYLKGFLQPVAGPVVMIGSSTHTQQEEVSTSEIRVEDRPLYP